MHFLDFNFLYVFSLFNFLNQLQYQSRRLQGEDLMKNQIRLATGEVNKHTKKKKIGYIRGLFPEVYLIFSENCIILFI